MTESPPSAAIEAIRTCDQIVQEGDDCCASNNGTCAAAAAWQHPVHGADATVSLCELHMKNAELFGGIQLGFWVVGTTQVPYPEGWTHIDDGRPLPTPALPKPAPVPSRRILP